jgi:23S rRNA A2030 N6-methylase RlmJ
MSGQRVVLWGGGSKAVALLTSLQIRDEVTYVIDINPNKHQTYLPGTGHAVMNPPYLAEQPPDVIIVMRWTQQHASSSRTAAPSPCKI